MCCGYLDGLLGPWSPEKVRVLGPTSLIYTLFWSMIATVCLDKMHILEYEAIQPSHPTYLGFGLPQRAQHAILIHRPLS